MPGPSRTKSLKKAIIQTLNYYDRFEYPLNAQELHMFLPIPVGKKAVSAKLQGMVKAGLLEKSKVNDWYTLNGKTSYFRKRKHRTGITQRKLLHVNKYFSALESNPYVQLTGISGSCAMNNAVESDDVDIFIVSTPGGIWTSRFTAILTAKAMNIHRSRDSLTVKDKVCLNLFFDERYLEVPDNKKNIYVAHEVVQMVPINMGEGVYSSYIRANKWVFNYFPNHPLQKHLQSNVESRHSSGYIDLIKQAPEGILKKLQLAIMKPHVSTERISDEQLWFFPDDYEKKVEDLIDGVH